MQPVPAAAMRYGVASGCRYSFEIVTWASSISPILSPSSRSLWNEFGADDGSRRDSANACPQECALANHGRLSTVPRPKVLCVTVRCAEKPCINFGPDIDPKFLATFPIPRVYLCY